jgi:putative PIG3 family NAD(P)H quinone oxidoreductase
MNAILDRDGQLFWEPVPDPVAGPGQVVITVVAAGVNRADLSQRMGFYPPPPGASPILGLEVSGRISAIGEGVTRWQVGDAVCALLAGGGYAEQVAVPEGQVLPVPDGVHLVDAAALPEVLATAWLNIFQEGGARAGQRVLIHAGGSGVGTAAIQLCAAFDVDCWVTVGSESKLERCVALGAKGGAVRGIQAWPGLVDTWTAGHGFDVILDPVGGSSFEPSLDALAVGGRLVIIGLMGGRSGTVDLLRLLTRRLRVQGSVLRSRSVAEKSDICASLRESVWPLVSAGRVRPIVEGRVPIAEAGKAHEKLASNESFGKMLLIVSDPVD